MSANSDVLPSQQRDPNAFLMSGGVPSASFLQIGASVTGSICEEPVLQQQRDMQTGDPKIWPDGNPMMQLVVTLQTEEYDDNLEDDDGRRRVYVKSHMKRAIADAVRKAKAKGLEVGGRLTVTYTANGEQTKRGFNPPKHYSADYVPPTSNYLNDERDEDNPAGAPAAKPDTLGDKGEVWGTVRGMQNKTGNRGPYWIVDTDLGPFFTNSVDIAKQARDRVGKPVTCFKFSTHPTSPQIKVLDALPNDNGSGGAGPHVAVENDDIPFAPMIPVI